jgi:hypothetical protein
MFLIGPVSFIYIDRIYDIFIIKLFVSVHRHCYSLQQQVGPQHWADVVVSGQGGPQAQGFHLQGHAGKFDPRENFNNNRQCLGWE